MNSFFQRHPRACHYSSAFIIVASWMLAFAGIMIMLLSPGSLAEASEPTKLDPALCRQVTKHTPSADIAYQPGIDVNGNAVVPADIMGTGQIQLPTKFDIPITINLAKVLNLNTNQYPNSVLGAGTESWIGTFTVDGEKTYFNGQPLTDAQQDNLEVLCLGQK